MIVKVSIKKGRYYDSVTLMIISGELNRMEGIISSSVVMGTAGNKAILASAGLMTEELTGAGDSDLIISVHALSEQAAVSAINKTDELFRELRKQGDEDIGKKARTLGDALLQMPGANLSLISVAGKYAAAEAMKALQKGLHVMIFSDNVPIEEELALKQHAHERGLLVMGPDCGTAIIHGIPLGFANAVGRGGIGIVAASGTGLQEVASVISAGGTGISQAIGTGGRDIKREIGGIMFLDAMKALAAHAETKVIVLVSKPPHREVVDRIAEEIRHSAKPVVTILIGGDAESLKDAGAITAQTLEEAGMLAVAISMDDDPATVQRTLAQRSEWLDVLAGSHAGGRNGRFLRGLFSGGTLCDEAQLVLKKTLGFVYSNTPLHPDYQIQGTEPGRGDCIIDMGDDAFTVGRPHPMIDYSTRNRRIMEETADREVAVILLDIVLGYGSHPDPASELAPVIRKACEDFPGILFIGSVTGTDGDPQDRRRVIRELEAAGMVIMPSNAAAAELAGKIILQIRSKKT